MAALEVTLVEAYEEACKQLGDALVQKALIEKRAYFPQEEAVTHEPPQ